MNARTTDEKFMRMALAEARKGIGWTSPNPAVGAVIVFAGQVISRGHHRGAGKAHAEIEALKRMRDGGARGATLYVTLEPCSTHGRTPPCTDAIKAAGIARVVIGAVDPNPAHAGRALKILGASGIEVKTRVLREECEGINRPFNKWITTGMPWVIAKAGISLDGRITRPPGETQWLTNAASRADSHELRARVDAILVGAGTVRADDPRLTVRSGRGARQPFRVVVTNTGELPLRAHILTDRFRDRTIICSGKTLRAVLRDLGKREITSVLIEGGTMVLTGAFEECLVDEVCFYAAPLFSGGPNPVLSGRGAGATAEAIWIADPEYKRIGDDVRMRGRVRNETP